MGGAIPPFPTTSTKLPHPTQAISWARLAFALCVRGPGDVRPCLIDTDPLVVAGFSLGAFVATKLLAFWVHSC